MVAVRNESMRLAAPAKLELRFPVNRVYDKHNLSKDAGVSNQLVPYTAANRRVSLRMTPFLCSPSPSKGKDKMLQKRTKRRPILSFTTTVVENAYIVPSMYQLLP